MQITPSEFFLETPLYTGVTIENENDLEIFVKRKYYDITEFHGYNPKQRLETTYAVHGAEFTNFRTDCFNKNGYHLLELRCKRSTDVFKFYVRWDADNKILMKIGQYPTIADFHIDQVKQYDKLLDKEKLREFTKAIGLAANGVGIGSFVYLRRIFEDLIYEAYSEYVNKNGQLDGFNKKRMADKIDTLHDFLPEFLVENKELYGILSKGIHELEEKDCLAHFDAVKVGIEMILDEKLEQLNKKKKAEAARLKIQQAASAITKPEVKS
ncbi:hypothetical protein [Pedobacter sp. BMA]|uniref:hypothetical protein n=1 Tax=Pedobacter sp. BMA TaxID=1663685 RepID=UPI00064B7FED|nr:hypothetical protein [Pedobacter sp. BMA]KLT64020.1 hypothetical protein AB669_18310 [Pedobacter sp. BMA]